MHQTFLWHHKCHVRATLFALAFMLLGLSPHAIAETIDMLRSYQSSAIDTDATPGVFTNAQCIANDSTDTRDVLVVASFSQETNGPSGVTATVSYRLALKVGASTTYSTTGQRFLDGGNDLGNGMLSWIFEDVSGSGTCDSSGTRFVLEHEDDNGTRTVKTSRITLLAIPLNTEPNDVPLDWDRATQGNVTTFSTTSTSFEPVTAMATVVSIDNVIAPRAAYVVATLSAETTNIVDASTLGEWTLQGSADSTNGTDGSWTNIGSQIERSMTSTNESGMIQLTAIVEDIDPGTYYFRVATRTNDALEPVVTKRAQMAAVSLVFDQQGGGYFPWFNDTYTGTECDATGSNPPDSLDGVVAANVEPNTTCDENSPDPLSDEFTLGQASDVFMTYVLNANTTLSGNGDVGAFESEVWSTSTRDNNTNVFGNDQNGEANEVKRFFADDTTDQGAMGQVALWDSGDPDNAAGTFYAYGGWSITGNVLETFAATIVGWVGASVVSPTAVTIGDVNLEALSIADYLEQLGVGEMDRDPLLNMLTALYPDATADLANANINEILDAIAAYLDPDGDGLVAVLKWDTLEERGTIGFYVERQQKEDKWTQINNDMLPGMITAPMGAKYMLIDPTAISGNTYQYRLIEQEATGNTRKYGPFVLEMP